MSIIELKANIKTTQEEIGQEAVAAARLAIDKCTELEVGYSRLFNESGHEAAQKALAKLVEASALLEGALSAIQNANEQALTYAAEL